MSAKHRARIAARALKLCGTRFRLHGRDPVHGLDCVGLVQQCLHAAEIYCPAPTGYALRGASPDMFETVLCGAGLQKLSCTQGQKSGDIILTRPSPVQLHLMVRVVGGYVHGHTGFRRVVFEPCAAAPVIVAIFRIPDNLAKNCLP